jgi:putative endonuclease
MARSHDFGRGCEALAAAELTRSGWRVVHRNFRIGHREIDLVIRRGRQVAFVEVKGRSGLSYGHPLESIGPAKRRDVEVAARGWISAHGRPGDRYRFDAVAVVRGRGGPARIDHIEDAWRAGE